MALCVFACHCLFCTLCAFLVCCVVLVCVAPQCFCVCDKCVSLQCVCVKIVFAVRVKTYCVVSSAFVCNTFGVYWIFFVSLWF